MNTNENQVQARKVGRPQSVKKLLYLVKDGENYKVRQRGKPKIGTQYLCVEVWRTLKPSDYIHGQSQVFNQYETTLEQVRDAKAAKGIKINVVKSEAPKAEDVAVSQAFPVEQHVAA